MRYTSHGLILAMLAALLPLAAAGGVFVYLGMTSDEPPGSIALLSAVVGLFTAAAMAGAGAAAGRRVDRRLQREAIRTETRLAALHELARGRVAAPPGAERGASVEDLGRLATALASETTGPAGPTLRRLLLFSDGARGRRRAGGAVDVNAAVRVCVEALEPRDTAASGPRLAFDPDPNVRTAPLDPDMLHILLVSLIENAREAAGPGGRVEIRTQLLGDRILVAVRDDGDGVPPDWLDRMFEPFRTTKPGAVGLGLTLCREIAEAHGGSIRAVNVLPHGLEVGLTLPLGSG